jgi:sec-independent protein translocase protein TatC
VIKKFFRAAWRVVTAPFRLIAWPFRAFNRFLNHDPDDVPLADAFANTLEDPSALIDHLEALRRHILRSMVVLIIAVLASTPIATTLLDWLAIPIGGMDQLQAIEPTEPIGAFMRATMLSGVALSMPWAGFELFMFVNPGLRPRERKLLLVIIPVAILLFLAGMAFTYYVMLPAALPFLLGIIEVETNITISSYFGLVTKLLFWVGVIFQFPLIIMGLATVGLVEAGSLLRGWRYAVAGISLVAAAITPTVDPVNMGIVMIPMIVLYFLSIGLAALAQRARTRRMEEPS